VAAMGGLAVSGDFAVVLGASEADICAPADFKLLTRVTPLKGADSKPRTVLPNGLSLTLVRDRALAALEGKGIALIKLPGGESSCAGSVQASSAPLVFTSPELGVKPVIATATTKGVDCVFLEDGTSHKSIDFKAEGSTPWGIAAAGEVLVVPREDRLYAVA